MIVISIAWSNIYSQEGYWQQHVDYSMDINMDVEKHQFTGDQVLVYTNNSPDTLHRVFYHLYFNAFQPGSMMDERSRTIADSDRRVGDRILYLSEDEIGYQKIESLTQDGNKIKYELVGTVLEVQLSKPILPGTSSTFKMKFNAQVPLQVRRSGRDNAEGIDLSMTQWYPKMAEYDYQGWHANPYIAREFHGVWGDFNVNISIDASYVIGATGVLQNADEIGHGYQAADLRHTEKEGLLTWRFKAENVIDFAWAADPDYKHISKVAHDGTMLHFIFQPSEESSENWAMLPRIMDEALEYINKNFGKYQFPQYTFIQGGDGGMEYPMITLITGNRNLSSLVGVSVHEWMHSWYQCMLATNESLYSWMDEGFTSFATSEVMNHLRYEKLIPGEHREFPHMGSTAGYIALTQSGVEEPLTTHSDHFNMNYAYGSAAYTKGSVYLSQLEYVVGHLAFRKGLLRYFNEWKFKHPTPNSLLRIMEKESGLELDWYNEYFVATTKTVDYGITNVEASGSKTKISLDKIGMMPMPIDLEITFKDGSKEMHYIPLRIMRGEKEFINNDDVIVHEDWPWTHSFYNLEIDRKTSDIESISIDPSKRMTDVNIENNVYVSQ